MNANQLGVCLAAFGGVRLAEALAEVEQAGLTIVDLPTDTTIGLARADQLRTDRRYRADVLCAIHGSGVQVTCVSNSRDTQLLLGPHGPHTDPVATGVPADKRSHALMAAECTVELAAELGVSQVRLMFGVPDHARWLSWWGSEVSWSDNIEAWVDAASPILDAAAAAGIELLVEPHPKQVAYDRPSTEALLEATRGLPGTVRLCIDPANLAAIGHDPVDAVHGWDDRLGAVHVKDLQQWTGRAAPAGAGWSRYGPQPPIRFRTLGCGDLPWPAIISALQDEDSLGTVYIEHEDALLPRRQGIAQAVQRLRELLPGAEPEGRTW